MKLFETEKPTIKRYEPTAQSLYVKWDDDRGRAFNQVTNFFDDGGYTEFDYVNVESGPTHIKIRNDGVRWWEFFNTPLEEGE